MGHESSKCRLKKESNVEVEEKKTHKIESNKKFEIVSESVENTKLACLDSSLEKK